MARGTADGGYNNYGTAANQSDPGSTPDRLLMGGGSMNKTGRVLWATGFEGQNAGEVLTDMYGESVGAGLTPLHIVIVKGYSLQPGGVLVYPGAWQGNNCLQILTDATLNSTYKVLKHFHGNVITGNLGIESMVFFDIDAVVANQGNANVDFIVFKSSASFSWTACIRFHFGVNNNPIQIQYLNSSNTFTTLADITQSTVTGFYGPDGWNNVKLIIDFANSKYRKLLYNNVAYDLSGIDMYKSSSFAQKGYAYFQFQLTTLDANAKDIFLDNIILTADEP